MHDVPKEGTRAGRWSRAAGPPAAHNVGRVTLCRIFEERQRAGEDEKEAGQPSVVLVHLFDPNFT